MNSEIDKLREAVGKRVEGVMEEFQGQVGFIMLSVISSKEDSANMMCQSNIARGLALNLLEQTIERLKNSTNNEIWIRWIVRWYARTWLGCTWWDGRSQLCCYNYLLHSKAIWQDQDFDSDKPRKRRRSWNAKAGASAVQQAWAFPVA